MMDQCLLDSRFWDKVLPEPNSGCWLWDAGCNGAGYGLLGDNTLAHRFSYELAKGPIPEGLVIDHLCRNRMCVNPDHLEAVTHRENLLRGTGPIPENHKKTHCKNGHLLAGDNLRGIKRPGRHCKVCHRDRQKKYHRRNSQAA